MFVSDCVIKFVKKLEMKMFREHILSSGIDLRHLLYCSTRFQTKTFFLRTVAKAYWHFYINLSQVAKFNAKYR